VCVKIKKRLFLSLSPRGVPAPVSLALVLKLRIEPSIKTLSSLVLYKKYIDNKKRELE
jgi:hypothetical protein